MILNFYLISLDSIFKTRLYTSNYDGVLRYTDQAETAELCTWTVDLAELPVFQQNRDQAGGGAFYTGPSHLPFCDP